MRAIGYQQSATPGDPQYLLDIVIPDPTPDPFDVLVRVEAVSVNPVDAKVRARDRPAEGAWRLLGWDAVGIVEAMGSAVTGFQRGERVWYAGALHRQGCNSELHVVDHRLVSRAPESLSPAQAAALPLTAITAWELLFDRLQLRQGPESHQGESLLVIGGAGGVGSILLQLARQLTGLHLIATASRPESADWALAMGAHQVINHREPMADQLADLGVPQVDRVISLTHTGEHFDQLVEVLKPQGALALIDDPPAAAINVLALKRKSLSLHWELMFTRSLFATPDLAQQGQILARVAKLVDQGRIRSTLADDLGPINAENLTAAHRTLLQQRCIGKLVLSGFGTAHP